MRVSDDKINSSLLRQIEAIFAQVISDLKTTNEADTFLRDFFKDSEFQTFAKRLAVAYWLKKGRSYENIKENLKVSSATIASIQETLASNGVKLAIKKMEAEEWANVWSEKIKKIVPIK